jgi:hypothetical protein
VTLELLSGKTAPAPALAQSPIWDERQTERNKRHLYQIKDNVIVLTDNRID